MTLHHDLHYAQVHVTNNEPIEAEMTETEDDIHFESKTLFGDLNRLTGKGRVYITADDGRTWHWDGVECTAVAAPRGHSGFGKEYASNEREICDNWGPRGVPSQARATILRCRRRGIQ
jgi:hypothetical protein